MESKYGERLDFWIDVAQSARLLKQSVGSDVALSKYDEATPRDPIPTEVILREHACNTNLVYLCMELGRVRHRCSQKLLEAFLKNNPSADVRGTACFTLATLLKDEAKHGQNKKAIAEAEKQLR